MDQARDYQYESVKFIEILIRYGGGVIGGKPIMKFVGLDCGPLRAPAHNFNSAELTKYRKELDGIGFLNSIKTSLNKGIFNWRIMNKERMGNVHFPTLNNK